MDFHWVITGVTTVVRNHLGARAFKEEIAQILDNEIKRGAVIGPFKDPPFPGATFLSPLNSIPKKDSQEHRLILDLSFPEGNSINDGIEKDWYLGECDKLVLPLVDRLVERIMALGRGCKMWKVDLIKAYRQIYLCPGCVNKVTYKFNGKFFIDIL